MDGGQGFALPGVRRRAHWLRGADAGVAAGAEGGVGAPADSAGRRLLRHRGDDVRSRLGKPEPIGGFDRVHEIDRNGRQGSGVHYRQVSLCSLVPLFRRQMKKHVRDFQVSLHAFSVEEHET